jgi:hypothetical protein
MKYISAFFLISAASQQCKQALTFTPATPPGSYRTAAVERCWWCELISQVSTTKMAINKSFLGVVVNKYSKYSTRLKGNMPGASGELVFPPDSPVWTLTFPVIG